jgi:glycosyltransferase involved in cell wall biosynthesis
MNFVKISIITPSFNQGEYVEQNILSVLNQDYKNFEHIVIDGGSTDKTVEVLRKYKHLKWISEKDEGQADALNKALAMATGDIIGWINSDDYYEPNIFHEIIREFEQEEIKWLIGDISFDYMLLSKRVSRKSEPVTYERLLKNPDILRQQGTFFRKSFLIENGGWDKQFHLVMDLDLWLRLAKSSKPKMLNQNLAIFRMQPDQKTSGKNLLKQFKEMKLLFHRENAKAIDTYTTFSKKYFYYFKDIVKQKLISYGFLNKVYSNIPVSAKKA